MTDSAYVDELSAVESTTPELAVRVLIWFLIGAIFLILVVAVAAVTKSLLTLIAGATTLLALIAVAGVAYLAHRVVRLEARVKALESEEP